MKMTRNFLIVVIAITVFLTVFAVCLIFDIGGLGTALAGFGGPIGAAIVGAFQAPLEWALSGGGPTILAFWAGIILLSSLATYFLIVPLIARIRATPDTTAPYQDSPTSSGIPTHGLREEPEEKADTKTKE